MTTDPTTEETPAEEETSIENNIFMVVTSFHELLASDDPGEIAIINAVWAADCLALAIKEHQDKMFEIHKDSPTAKMILNFMLMIADLNDKPDDKAADSNSGEQH